MADAYFTLIRETDDAVTLDAQPHTVGPWAPSAQHGGPPCALAVAFADRHVRRTVGRDDLIALRLAADFLGPVPVGVIDATARVLRQARSAVLVEVELSAAGRVCLLARVWFVRDADTDAQAAPRPEPVTVPDVAIGNDARFGYADSLEWRYVRGSMRTLGPGAVWVRGRLPLVDAWDAPPSGLALVALVADSASGISAELDWAVWSFVNVDLDIHLARPFVGEWVYVDAETDLGGHGSALARSTIGDVRGRAGRGLQTLVLSRLRD